MSAHALHDAAIAVAGLQKEYDEMMEDVSPDGRTQIEASGPISDDWFIAVRQRKFRELTALESGTIIPERPGELMHIRV